MRGAFTDFLLQAPGTATIREAAKQGIQVPACGAAQALQFLDRDYTVRELRELVLGGVFGRLGRANVQGDALGQARRGLEQRYHFAATKGQARTYRAASGAVKAELAGKNYLVEALSRDLIQVGATYPAFVVERQVGDRVVPFLVPVHFETCLLENSPAGDRF